jgi:peptide/nickel transport system permease protein
LRARLGLDDPLPAQYGRFLSDAVRGHLGQSLRTGRPVTTELSEKLGATVLLAITAMAVALVVAVPLGVIAAVRAGTWVDNVAMALALVGVSMPNFWLGPLLALLFGVHLGWLPISGRGPSAEFLIGSVPRVPPEYLVLPALTLGLALAAILARMTRASLVEELKELYVRAARARGLSTRRTVWRHALRNGLIPIITIVGLQFGAVLTGTIITETIFAWPGLGRLLIQSIQFRDYPMVQGCILLIAVTYVAVNLLTDLAYGLADPRIRYE